MLLESNDLVRIEWIFSVGFIKIDERKIAAFGNMRKERIIQYISLN